MGSSDFGRQEGLERKTNATGKKLAAADFGV
jgi:hypothetical protein